MSVYTMTYISSTIASTVQNIGKWGNEYQGHPEYADYLKLPPQDFVTKLKSVADGADDSTLKKMYPGWMSKLLDLQIFWRAIKVAVVGEKDENGNLIKKGLRQLNLVGSAVDLKIVYSKDGSFVLLNGGERGIDVLDAIDQYYTRYLESSERSAGGYKDTQLTQPQDKATGEPEKKEDKTKTEEQEQKRKEEIKKQGETTPGIQDQAHLNNSTTADQPQNFDAAEYVPLLCKYFNQATRSSTKTPQVPVSVLVSIALARTGFDPKKLQHYDFWCLAYDKEISETPNYSEGRCGFESFNGGINGVMKLLQRDKSSYAADLSELKPKMSDSSEDAKKNTIKKILTRLNSATPNSVEEQYKVAIGYIDKYKLFEWDADKTKEKGGHSDDTPTSENDKNLGKISQEIDKVFKEYSDKLKGAEFKIESIPQGGDFVLLVKLPKGRCYCEPIYPDLVVVGDSVPAWIYSQEYVEAYAAAEKEVLKAYGLSTATSEEEAALEAANEAIENFKDQQFKAWCLDYGIDYGTEEERAEALKQYEAAAAKNEYNYFTDGIYMPDESSKSTYQALQTKRNLALKDNTNAATRYTQAQYDTALKATAQTIQEREGSWNQDTGTYISTATPDATDIIGSQVTPGGSTATDTVVVVNTANGDIEKAVTWAESKKDKQYSQDQDKREGPDYYDCSSLIYWALEAGGFGIIAAWQKNKRYSATGTVSDDGSSGGYGGKQKSGDADTIWEDLQRTASASNWTKNSYSSMISTLKRGDIVTFKGNASAQHITHVAFMIDGERTIEAKNSQENIGNFSVNNRNAQEVFRYTPPVVTTTTVDSRISKLIDIAKKICDDPNCVYKTGGTGPKEFDCSGFVVYCLTQAGFSNISRGDESKISAGFKKMNFPGKDKLQIGDILIRGEEHEAIYIGDGKAAAAHGQSAAAASTVEEQVDVRDVGTNWTHILRFVGGITTAGNTSGGTVDMNSVAAKLTNTQTANRTNQIIVVIQAQGMRGNLGCFEKSGSMWTQKFSCVCNGGDSKVSNRGSTQSYNQHRVTGSRQTPVGSFPLKDGFGHQAAPSGITITYHQTTASAVVGLDDVYYPNGGVLGEQVGDLNQYGAVYDYAVIIGYNQSNRIVHSTTTSGGNIFLHCWSNENTGTAGCVAVATENMKKILQFLKSGAWMIIVNKEQDLSQY